MLYYATGVAMTLTTLMLACITSFSFADDLLGGIERSSELGTDRKLHNISFIEDSQSRDFDREDFEVALKNARNQKMRQLQYKIQLLDEAHVLPKNRRKKYQKQQRELQGFRNELASRTVEAYAMQKSEELKVPVADFANDYLHLSAVKVYETINDNQQREEFKIGWKASMVDRGARTAFGTMLAMINLYGIDHKLVKSFNNSLEAYRASFNRVHNDYSGKIPKQERNDYIYRIFRKSNLILDKPLQLKLDKITLMESELSQKNQSLKAKKLVLRKLEFEKEIFVNLLQSDGLDLEGDEGFALENVERKVEDWFEDNAIEPEELLWPFDEPGEVLSSMRLPSNPYCTIRTIKHHLIRSPADGKVIQNNSGRLLVSSSQHWIMFEGNFSSSLAKSSKVSSSQVIAMNESPYEVRITLQNTSKDKSWKDICELR